MDKRLHKDNWEHCIRYRGYKTVRSSRGVCQIPCSGEQVLHPGVCFHNSAHRWRDQKRQISTHGGSITGQTWTSEWPGGSSSADQDIYWANVGNTYTVTAEMCSFNATAGIGESVTVHLHLDGSPKVRDSVLILTNVVQRYELESSVPRLY